MAAEVTLGPVALDEGRRWMARVLAYEVEGELWPVSMEVRLKAEPCAHDREPQSQDKDIEWERQDCHCWPPSSWPPVDALPPGGMPVRLLKNLHLGRLVGSYVSGADYMVDHPDNRAAEHFQAVVTASEKPKQRGRPRLDAQLHLRRLAELDAAYAVGLPQTAAARRLDIAPQTLRVSLEWGRRQDPPVWTRSGRGRPGRLTSHGHAAMQGLIGEGPAQVEPKRDRPRRRKAESR